MQIVPKHGMGVLTVVEPLNAPLLRAPTVLILMSDVWNFLSIIRLLENPIFQNSCSWLYLQNINKDECVGVIFGHFEKGAKKQTGFSFKVIPEVI